MIRKHLKSNFLHNVKKLPAADQTGKRQANRPREAGLISREELHEDLEETA